MQRPSLAVLVALAATPAVTSSLRAQDVLDLKSATEIRTRFLADLDTVHVKIMALAQAIPEVKYTWQPAPGTRTVANALMHVATEWYVYVPMVVGAKPPAGFGVPREAIPKLEQLTAKAEVIDHLTKGWEHARQQLLAADLSTLLGPRQLGPQSITLAQFAFVMAGDLHEHLGQLVTYARSVGVVPPWSAKAGS